MWRKHGFGTITTMQTIKVIVQSDPQMTLDTALCVLNIFTHAI